MSTERDSPEEEIPPYDDQVNRAIEVLIDDDADMIFSQAATEAPGGGINTTYSLGTDLAREDGQAVLVGDDAKMYTDMMLQQLMQHIAVVGNQLNIPPHRMSEMVSKAVIDVDSSTEYMNGTRFDLVEDWETEN